MVIDAELLGGQALECLGGVEFGSSTHAASMRLEQLDSSPNDAR
jgi:hypothetical protein